MKQFNIAMMAVLIGIVPVASTAITATPSATAPVTITVSGTAGMVL